MPQVSGDRPPVVLNEKAAAELPQGASETGARLADLHQAHSINTAQVIQSMQGTEMRVGMHSAEFGNLSIATSINASSSHPTLAAEISFEHGELGRALSSHLPAIETRLASEYGMSARIEVRDQSLGSSASFAGQQDRGAAGSGQGRSGAGSSAGWSDRLGSPAASAGGTSVGLAESADAGRLSIRI